MRKFNIICALDKSEAHYVDGQLRQMGQNTPSLHITTFNYRMPVLTFHFENGTEYSVIRTAEYLNSAEMPEIEQHMRQHFGLRWENPAPVPDKPSYWYRQDVLVSFPPANEASVNPHTSGR